MRFPYLSAGRGLSRSSQTVSCHVRDSAGADPVLGGQNATSRPNDDEAVHAFRQGHQGQKHGKDPF